MNIKLRYSILLLFLAVTFISSPAKARLGKGFILPDMDPDFDHRGGRHNTYNYYGGGGGYYRNWYWPFSRHSYDYDGYYGGPYEHTPSTGGAPENLATSAATGGDGAVGVGVASSTYGLASVGAAFALGGLAGIAVFCLLLATG